MKVALSIPDPVFKDAEKLAKKMRLSRSALYAKAMEAFLKARRDDEITRSLNEFYSKHDSRPDEFLKRAARATLRRSEW